MTTLITGGAGYIGSTVAQVLLAAGKKVRVLDCLLHGGRSLLGFWTNPDFEFIRGDVREPADIEAALAGDVEAVVHLAAIVGDPACARSPYLAKSTNLDGSLSVYEAAKRKGVSRFVFASTCSNYGKMSSPDAMVDESSELAPVSLYAETKVEIEKMILADTNGSAFTPTCLRFATIYGVAPRMRFDLTVNEFTMEMARKKHLVVFGEQFWRPYVHVFDAARAIRMVLEARPELVRNEVFNVGATDQNYQKKRLVELIQARVPDAAVDYVHKDEDPRDYRVAFGKVQDRLGFRLTRTVEDGIEEVLTLARAGVIDDYGLAEYHNSPAGCTKPAGSQTAEEPVGGLPR